MSPVDPRTLKPGQRVRWTRTVEGIVGDVEHAWAGEGYVATVDVDDEYGDRHSVMVFSGRHGMDTFEVLSPPLPTTQGDQFVAILADGCRRLLEVVISGGPGYEVVGSDGERVDPEDITEWALLDGVHTVRDPEPPCLFMDEHQRWGLTTARAGEHWTSRDGVDGTLVECSRCGPGNLLLDPDEEQPGSAPEAERPVPPKGLGAVIKARVLGESYDSTLVRAVTGDQNCWHSLASSGATWWFSDDQVTVTEVLHPGIEVPS